MADEDDDADRDDLDDDADELNGDDEFQTVVSIEIAGLSLYTHHGVTAAEREIGQRLLVDVTLEVGEPDATVTDMVEDTVDYGEVCNTVSLVAQQRSYKTLERLSTAIADRLLADYAVEYVSVKCTKPEPPIALPVDEVSVTVWRERGDEEE
jgi:dihydroneopterin aldolase